MGENGDGISLPELGSTVKPEFEATDLPWLYGVVSGLAKDGLAVIAEDAAVYDAGNTGEPDHLSVRLP